MIPLWLAIVLIVIASAAGGLLVWLTQNSRDIASLENELYDCGEIIVDLIGALGNVVASIDTNSRMMHEAYPVRQIELPSLQMNLTNDEIHQLVQESIDRRGGGYLA